MQIEFYNEPAAFIFECSLHQEHAKWWLVHRRISTIKPVVLMLFWLFLVLAFHICEVQVKPVFISSNFSTRPVLKWSNRCQKEIKRKDWRSILWSCAWLDETIAEKESNLHIESKKKVKLLYITVVVRCIILNCWLVKILRNSQNQCCQSAGAPTKFPPMLKLVDWGVKM